jgi:plasmid maintenance system antidote protein VapI
MNETRIPGQELQDEILKTVRKSQEAVVDAIKAWADTVQSITPKLPAVSLPLADRLPKPEDVVASAYDFAEQLLAGQRRFAEDVLKATAPLAQGKSSGQAAKATAAAK